MIDGKQWVFIRKTENNKYLFFYMKSLLLHLVFFSMNDIGDFIKGVDKIETAHDHSPEIFGNYLEVKLSNGQSIDVYLIVGQSTS